MIPVTNLRPFTRMLMTIGQIPTSYLISMTYEEQLLWLCNYLEKEVIPALNNNAEAVKEVQELYTELKSYVDNYFENLDVQEEINNKLDEMAESGQLTDIIAQYLGLAGVLAFDTISDMSSATNITEGSICRTLGEATYNDGKGAFYKVRTLTSGDVIDGVNIVALSASNTLIAEKMPDYYINELTNRINSIFDKKYVFMGDSYADGYSPDGDTTSWISLLVNKMNLSSGQYISTHAGGLGFSTNRPNYNFISLLQNLTADDSLTDLYVCGGYNDAGQTKTNIINGISNFKTLFDNKFPNAKLHIGFIGWSSNSNTINNLKNAFFAYKEACELYNIDLMNGVQFALHNYFKYFSSDGIHPNQNGQNSIANALYNCIVSGDAKVYEKENLYFNIAGSVSNSNIEMILSNGYISVNNLSSSLLGINFTDTITITGNQLYEIGDITNSLVIGSDLNNCIINFTAVVQESASSYSHQQLQFIIKNKKLYVSSPHASGNNYSSINIKAIQIINFNQVFNALCC